MLFRSVAAARSALEKHEPQGARPLRTLQPLMSFSAFFSLRRSLMDENSSAAASVMSRSGSAGRGGALPSRRMVTNLRGFGLRIHVSGEYISTVLLLASWGRT